MHAHKNIMPMMMHKSNQNRLAWIHIAHHQDRCIWQPVLFMAHTANTSVVDSFNSMPEVTTVQSFTWFPSLPLVTLNSFCCAMIMTL